MDTVDKQGALAAAIAAATGEVGAVAKTGRNTHDRYTYSSDEDFARAVQPVMARHGLALVPIQMDAVWYDTETRKGSTMRGCVLTVRWLLMHSAGGSQEMVTIGEGIDRADKAAYKAQTGARKYALRLAFQTPTSDDAEQHSPEPRRTGPTLDQWRSRLRAITDRGTDYVRGAWAKTPAEVREQLGLDFLTEITEAASKHDATTDTDGADLDAALGG